MDEGNVDASADALRDTSARPGLTPKRLVSVTVSREATGARHTTLATLLRKAVFDRWIPCLAGEEGDSSERRDRSVASPLGASATGASATGASATGASATGASATGASATGARHSCLAVSVSAEGRNAQDSLRAAEPPRPQILPPRFFDPSRAVVRTKGNLPHWQQPRCACFVTWRTADSLPQSKLAELEEERMFWTANHPHPWDSDTRREYNRLFEGRIQEWLDAGGGACVLRQVLLRRKVEDVLRRFDGSRYQLYALVVMPNHVHVLFMPLGEQSVRDIVRTWKGVSARAVNQALGATGDFWQKESWDHLVRSERQFAKFVRYIRTNDPTIAYSVYGEGTEDE